MTAQPNQFPIPTVGVAHSGYVGKLLEQHSEMVDFIEIPFEMLRHDPSVFKISELKPIVLHCASLSIGGSVCCNETTLDEIKGWVDRTNTPWIGEHLAFITADRALAGLVPEPCAPGEPFNIGYTVSPPMNWEAIERVERNFELYSKHFNVPILLENSPIYFTLPSSTMPQVDFIGEICHRVPVSLLLDLAHFYITSQTMGFNVFKEIERLPLERVMEIHISGIDTQVEGIWDNHADRAPSVIYELLEIVLKRAPVRAITLEYNWSLRFPTNVLLEELVATRRLIESVGPLGNAKEFT